jgi:Tfp pilus assembly protein FimT
VPACNTDIRSASGTTLLELVIVLAIVAVIMTTAIPFLGDLMADQHRTSVLNGLVRAAHLARSEAIKRGHDAVICASADGKACSGDAEGWKQGWIVFVNADADQPPVVDPGEALVHHSSELHRASLHGNRSAFVFRPFGKRATNGTLVYCDSRGERHARAFVISYTGRPRLSPEGPGGRALACPQAAR